MNRRVLPLGAIEANCVVLWNDPAAAWIVDPGGEPEELVRFLKDNGLTPAFVVLTHAHFDHIGALPGLLKVYPDLPIHVGPGDVPMFGHPMNAWEPEYVSFPKPASVVADLEDGARLEAGGLKAHVIATPGHTPGGICLHFEDDAYLVTGDTLFAGSVGRTDFPGGSMPTLQKSLEKLKLLPPETVVQPGHGGPTSIARECASNPFLA